MRTHDDVAGDAMNSGEAAATPGWRRALRVATAAMLIGAAPAAGTAAAAVPSREGDVTLHDFKLETGQSLPVLKLHYYALGTPITDASGKIVNAVLLLHSTTGTGKTLLVPTVADHLFQPGQPLDATRYLVILPDGIGFGGSTKPSDGMGARFPHYGYVDQVEAAHAMLAEMGIDHLKLVLGISQGGMQAWLWAERFPDAMDAVVPIACMPEQISGRDLMWRRIVIAAIHNDPAWNNGAYPAAQPPTAWKQIAAPMFAMMTGTPERLETTGPDRAKALAHDAELVAKYRDRDAADSLYDYESSADYDPAPAVGRIRAPLLAINFADDVIIPPEFKTTQETVARLPDAKFVMLPGGWGHAAIFHADIWADSLGAFLKSIPARGD